MNWKTIATTTKGAAGGVVRWLFGAGLFLLWPLVVVGVAMPAAAEPTVDAEEDQLVRVDAIIVEGLLRTKRRVVKRELLFEEGDIATVGDVEESIQRLRNTGMFSRVDYELVDRRIGAYSAEDEVVDIAPEGRLLRVQVEERWTLTAFFQFGQGGDTFQILVGAQDTNLRGRYQHLEAMYSRLGDTNSFSALYRNPRFLDARQTFSVQGSLNNRLYTFFDRDGDIDGGFLRNRRHTSLRLEREWRRHFATGVRTSFADDRFRYDLVDDERRQAQQEGEGLPAPMQTLEVGVTTRLGQLDRDEYRRDGTIVDLGAYQSAYFGAASRRSRRARASFHHFSDLPRHSTFGARAQTGVSTSEFRHRHFSAGGLDAVRGTYDMRYRGPYYWLANVELRIPSIKTPWLVLQHVAFVDAVGVTDDASSLAGVTAATTGLGIRIISRDFAGLLFRIDYALPVLDADGPAWSFGAGQFF